MTRKHRSSPPSPQISLLSSSAGGGGRDHRRRIPREKAVEEDDDEDYADASGFRSQYDNESKGDEYEPSENEEDDDDAASIGTVSVSNSPGDPSSYIPESNNIEGKNTSMSASNFPNLSQPITRNASYSYVKIAPLPIFRGTPGECPITHLSRFSKVCRANNASSIHMLMRIFPVTLEEEAAHWYDLNIELFPSLSWDEIKLSFLQAYHEIELVEELRSEIMTINQGEKESVRSYFLRLQWILKRWPEHGLPETLLKGVFIDGLRAEFHDWVLLQKPNSLNAALRLAFCFEQLRSIRGTKQMGPTCGFCEGLHEERSCEVREGMKELWRQSKEKPGSVSSAKNGSDKAAKDFSRSFSMDSSSGHGETETDEGEKGGEAMKKKKKQYCQCTKHQCWKKKDVRNSSLISRI